MNMQTLMAQAKKIQNDMERLTKEIENKEFESNNGVIKVIMTGNYELKQVEIIDSGILEDKSIVEDMIQVVTNDVLKQIKKEKDEKLGKYTGGLGGIF